MHLGQRTSSNLKGNALQQEALHLDNNKVSILVPVYNEYTFLRKCIQRVINASLPHGLDREIILVDDCSTDGTREVVKALAAENPGVIRAVYHDENSGKGAAIRTAVKHAKGAYTLIQDADLEYDPADYPELLEPLLMGVADVVYGSRFAPRNRRAVLNYHHALGNIFLTHLSNATTGLYLTDMETCYKVFRTDILKTIPIRSDRFGIEPEITAKISKRGCRVYETPINYYGRGYAEGKKIGWKDGFAALWTILKYWVIDDCYEKHFGRDVLDRLSAARRFSRWMVDTIEPWLGQRILEVGGGIGNVSRFLPRRQQLTITDIDATYLDVLSTSFQDDETVHVARLDVTSDEDCEALGRENFDSIVLLNVLEHIEDDVSALRRLYGLLEPGGTLVVLVPQYEWLYGSFDRNVGHKRRYTRNTLRRAVESAGFRMETMLSFNFLAIPGWWLNGVVLQREEMGRFQIKVFDMLVPVMRVVERFAPLPGISLMACAKKPKV